MAKTNIFVLILFLVLVVIAGYFLFTYRVSVLKAPENNSAAKETILKIEDKKIVDNTKPFKIDITYPEITGADDFNKKVKGLIDSKIAEFKKNSLENDKAVKETDPENYAKYPREYDLNIGYDKGRIDENVISVILEVYAFEGGAHGATSFMPINYNPKTRKDILLADLFPEQSGYLKKISDYCIANLTKQVENRMESAEGAWVNDGAAPKAENFSLFLINKNDIVFYFPQYQVAPYAAGDFKVPMPR